MVKKRGGLKEMKVVGNFGEFIQILGENEGLYQRELGKEVNKKKADFRISEAMKELEKLKLIIRSEEPPKGKRKKSAKYVYLTDRGREVYNFFFGVHVALVPLPDERKKFIDELINDLNNDEISNNRKELAFSQLLDQFDDLSFYTDWESYPEFEKFISDLIKNMEENTWVRFNEIAHLLVKIYERGFKNNSLISILKEKFQSIDRLDISNSLLINLTMLVFIDFEKNPKDIEESKKMFYLIIEKNVDNIHYLSNYEAIVRQHKKVSKILKDTLRKDIYDLSDKYGDKYTEYFKRILFALSREA